MRQTVIEGKKFLIRNSVHTRPVEENSEKNCKKIKKITSGIISVQNGLIEAEKERKKFYPPILFILDPGKKILEKIAKELKKELKKTSSRHYFQPKRDEIGREREKKNLFPNSVRAQPEQENSKKIKKITSGIISVQNGLSEAEKERKKIYLPIPFILDTGKKIPEKIAKIIQKI